MIVLLLLTSAALGLLSFFEPCTIATHTVFAARSHAQHGRGVLTLWITRSIFLAAILAVAAQLIPSPHWGPYLPSIVLAAIALPFIISRFMYLPVPHFTFYKLIPGGARWPQPFQLAWTLPACALPLFGIVGGVAVTLHHPLWAAIAGAIYASAFTLPVITAAWLGTGPRLLGFLDRTAPAAPVVTAVGLILVALLLLSPHVSTVVDSSMVPDVLRHPSFAALALGFGVGFLFSFEPLALASLGMGITFVTRGQSRSSSLWLTGAFLLGMILTQAFLGGAAAEGGHWVHGIMGRQWGVVLGPVAILLGLLWAGLIKIRLSWFSMRAMKVEGPLGAFMLGIPFAVAVCPFCTPALLVMLTASASVHSLPFGVALLSAFAVGRSLPVLTGATGLAWLERFPGMEQSLPALKVMGGVVMIAMGLYLLNGYFYWLPSLAAG
ncbi:cytochrome c biogenesis CcdA family protein [Acidithiobacillus acidisediminis]|uniref:cytochrome c biogenesis CcdA family protein n=1 Tax=Acidithiobacillus acidisediminis TaxID=2937799 RepID=UPI0020106CBD|nr:cytochrome c biogenesis protein CcdA [Acidithiobacillus sp. S30A2]